VVDCQGNHEVQSCLAGSHDSLPNDVPRSPRLFGSQRYRGECEQTALGSVERKRHHTGSHVQTSAGYVTEQPHPTTLLRARWSYPETEQIASFAARTRWTHRCRALSHLAAHEWPEADNPATQERQESQPTCPDEPKVQSGRHTRRTRCSITGDHWVQVPRHRPRRPRPHRLRAPSSTHGTAALQGTSARRIACPAPRRGERRAISSFASSTRAVSEGEDSARPTPLEQAARTSATMAGSPTAAGRRAQKGFEPAAS
jgi:hypothetical protein